jgi:D-alanine-D-alanine ligase-like ATP-grasp enzyme
MVEAEPLKLSYTIYPGEKFFDGQLVAVEENRLVFRRVVKMSNGKFVSSVENKPLRKYTDREQIQGTAPVEDNRASAEPAPPVMPVETQVLGSKPTGPVVSPLEEMNRQVPTASGKPKKESKKSVKVAKSN